MRLKRSKTKEESSMGDDEASFHAFNSPKRLPAWLDHFNAKDLKILFKCSLAVWILTLFIYISDTLRVLGQSAFFGCVVLFIMPPSGVVFIHFAAGVMICVGLALGWAWGVITMKAALATRPLADLQQRYAELQQSMPQNTTNVDQASGQATYQQIAIYEGFMLDTRVSVTYFCMMGLFVYLMARLRVSAPNLMLVSMFSMIVADIYFTTAPLIPTFNGTIPKVLILPSAIAVGVGVVCNLLFFPQSTSQITLGSMADLLRPMNGYVKALTWHFKTRARFEPEQLQALKSTLTVSFKSVESAVKFLPLDFSYRRWSPEDIKSFQEPLRQVLVSFGELLQMSISREELFAKDEALTKAAEELEKSDNEKHPLAYHIAKAADLRELTRHPDTEEMIVKAIDALSLCATPLLQTLEQSVNAIIEAFSGASQNDTISQHEQILASLQEALEDFEDTAAEQLIAPHAHLFDANGKVIYNDHRAPPLLGLMSGLLYQERLINLTKNIGGVLERAIEVERVRTSKRVWLPKGLQHIFSLGLSQDAPPSTIPNSNDLTRTMSVISKPEKKRGLFSKKRKEKEDPEGARTTATILESMEQPTSRRRSKSSLVFLALINFFTGVEGLHALRALVLTIALAVPAVIPSSAGFYYREKGLWALIMAQMALEPYMSDFTSGILIRTLGTVAGGILGLLCWYIGSGNGPGNPYGLAAIMAVAIIGMMWWRLFAPPQHMAAGIMLTSTMYMVMSYSWVDTHIPSYGNPGVGYEVFWRRILLVLIGFGAAVLVALLPRPLSGNRHYRQILSSQLSSIRDRYALLISVWRSPPDDFVEVIEKQATTTEELLNSIALPILKTKFEFSTSNIDTETLSRANHLCNNLNVFLAQFSMTATKIPLPVRERFFYRVSAGDENLIADLMSTMTLLQHSLMSGEPLPAILPTPLVGRAIQFRRLRGDFQDEGNSKEYLAKQEGRQWSAAVYSFVRFLGTLDELVIVVKKSVGERSHINAEALGGSIY
ncbi:membrane protein [Fusarium fujikuroi]|nr:membrane protein [Fusarium fujikuroi]SCO57944.1 related to membrane protein [Fusarium fujikuroi]